MTSEHKRAVGVFASPQPIEQALNELKSSGFPMEKISIIGKDLDPSKELSGVQVGEQVGTQRADAPETAASLASGTAWTSILVGLTSLAIPGVGPVIAAGSVGLALAATVAGTGLAAATTQNLVKGLANLGIPHKQAEVYSDRLQTGNYLLMLEGTNDEISRAEGVFSQKGIRDWGVYSA